MWQLNEACHSGIFGTSSMYAGASARVTSAAIGRDINPLGRGDGQAYVGTTKGLITVDQPLLFIVI